MNSPEELFLETSNTPVLTGKARAKARSEAWKIKQNERFIAEMDAKREERLFPGLDAEGRAQMYARYAEIEERARLERQREESRYLSPTAIEPTVDVETTDFQTISLPATTVPIVSAVQDVYAALRQRAGPSISSWCPPEALYRLTQAQFLFVVDPFKYHSLSTACDYNNFEGIVRAIQLNAHYVDDKLEIIPQLDHLNPRCITLESVDRYRNLPAYIKYDVFSEIITFDLCLLRTMRSGPSGFPSYHLSYDDENGVANSVLPVDYCLTQLHQDGRAVAQCLKYYLPSDSDMFRPRNVLTPLLLKAPYLALLHQLPIGELAHRDEDLIIKAVFPESFKMTFPLTIRARGKGRILPILSLNDSEREELVMMTMTGILPSVNLAWIDITGDVSV